MKINMKIKNNFPFILTMVILLTAAFRINISKLGLIYMSYNIWIEMAVNVVSILILTVLSVKYRHIQSEMSEVCCAFLPLVSLSLCFTNFNFETFFILPATGFICGSVLFVMCGKGVACRVVAGVLAAVMLMASCIIISMAWLLMNFGENTVVNQIESPEGNYTAEIIDSDQGALGGATWVEISFNKGLYLPFGKIVRDDINVYTGRWGEYKDIKVYWLSEQVLSVNGRRYNIDALVRPDRGNYYYRYTMGIFVPERKADFSEDTHGGFHGDGDELLIFNLSDSEIKTLENDILKSNRWKRIDNSAKLNLYGGDGAPWHSGFLQNRIPHVEGYYCFYNKKTKKYEFPLSGTHYSYNYIAAVYSPEMGTLYIYGLDT